MTPINQEYSISAEKLDEEWEKLYDRFDDCPRVRLHKIGLKNGWIC